MITSFASEGQMDDLLTLRKYNFPQSSKLEDLKLSFSSVINTKVKRTHPKHQRLTTAQRI